ncbi:hypothetical protein C2G38_2218937 [Gigaspora rosea]|uniref:Uncharacterized protein n=1 Tax=Gigaspora rosea TaxID=44941 RepID=A0A397UAF0_9GLOM|nr:hypothetical protein C2G38_2218937 [Gigaspora rosea]CAG8449054.1 1224_t:CDS:2 [Gigaspora rosea]
MLKEHCATSPSRAHDCIIVKIDPVPKGEMPVRMKAWHYCVSDRRTRSNIPARTMFEFGTKDGTGAPLNILKALPDPITIDFFLVRPALKVAQF